MQIVIILCCIVATLSTYTLAQTLSNNSFVLQVPEWSNNSNLTINATINDVICANSAAIRDSDAVKVDDAVAEQLTLLPNDVGCSQSVQGLSCQVIEGGVRWNFRVRCTWRDSEHYKNEAYWLGYWYLSTYSRSSSVGYGRSSYYRTGSSSSSSSTCTRVGRVKMIVTNQKWYEFDAQSGENYQVTVFGMYKSDSIEEANKRGEEFVNCLANDQVSLNIPNPIGAIIGGVVGGVLLLIIIVIIIICCQEELRDKFMACFQSCKQCRCNCCKRSQPSDVYQVPMNTTVKASRKPKASAPPPPATPATTTNTDDPPIFVANEGAK